VLWLDGKFADALNSRTLSDLATLSHEELLRVMRASCRGRHREFQPDQPRLLSSPKGVRRPIYDSSPESHFHEYIRLATGKTDAHLADWVQREKGGDFSKWALELQLKTLDASTVPGRWVAAGCPKK